MSEYDIFNFEPSRIHEGEIFPSAIERDPWIMFHGTSSTSSEAIEGQGFTYVNHSVRLEDIEAISRIFLEMKWIGDDPGGFGVLHAFSRSDFSGGDTRIFFGETGTRSLLYASRDFSGGEKMRAIRRSWRDLELFLADERIREKHYADQQRELNFLRNCGVATHAADSPARVDLGWLEASMREVQYIADTAIKAENMHAFGVIYAVRFDEADRESLSYSGTMGLSARAVVPASRIIAKMVIPAEFDGEFIGRQVTNWYIEKISSGLVRCLVPPDSSVF